MDLTVQLILKSLYNAKINTRQCIEEMDKHLTGYYNLMVHNLKAQFLLRDTINKNSMHYGNGAIVIAINQMIEENARLRKLVEEGTQVGINVPDHSIDYNVPFSTASEIFKAFEHISRDRSYDHNVSSVKSHRTHDLAVGSFKPDVFEEMTDSCKPKGSEVEDDGVLSKATILGDVAENSEAFGAVAVAENSGAVAIAENSEAFRAVAVAESPEAFGAMAVAENHEVFLAMAVAETPEAFRAIAENPETFGAMAVGGNLEDFGAMAVGGNLEDFGAVSVSGYLEDLGDMAVGKNLEDLGAMSVAGNPETFGAVAVTGSPEVLGAVADTTIHKVDNDGAAAAEVGANILPIVPLEMECNAGYSLNVQGAEIPDAGEANQPLRRCKMFPPKREAINDRLSKDSRRDSIDKALQYISLDPCVDTKEHNEKVAYLFRECLKHTRFYFNSVKPHLNCTKEYNQCHWVLYLRERFMCDGRKNIQESEIYLMKVFQSLFRSFPLEVDSVSLISAKKLEWAVEISSPCNCWLDDRKKDEKKDNTDEDDKSDEEDKSNEEDKSDENDRKTDDKDEKSKDKNLKQNPSKRYESKGARPRIREKMFYK